MLVMEDHKQIFAPPVVRANLFPATKASPCVSFNRGRWLESALLREVLLAVRGFQFFI